MGYLIVGDGHYAGREGEAGRWAALLERAEQAGLRELSILGDFFEVWVGLAGLESAWHEPFFAPLRRLRSRGVRLSYVVGNKDYFIEEWNARHGLFDRVASDELVLDAAGRALHLAHGDLVNRRDRQYRAWRAFSRSAPVRAVARALPRTWLGGLARDLEQRLRATNRYHKSYFPEEELRARARALPPGEALLVYGHFHQHRELVEGDKRIVTLPFLGGESAGVWLDEMGVRRFPR